jgi:hypothetical protein
MTNFSRFACLLFLTICRLSPTQAETRVIYPGPKSDPTKALSYEVKLLALALQKSGGEYKLEAGELDLPQQRSIVNLTYGKQLDVLWTMTSVERETELLPIRIPIDKGLLGWRLLFVRASELPLFAQITDAKELQRLLAGQGHDWPDTGILQNNGYRVYGVSNNSGLFEMLNKNRLDYFPRSVQEIWIEAACKSALNLVIEPNIALHYPTAKYFFVRRGNLALANAIESGLEIALADGSFDRLFLEQNGLALARAQLAKRRVFTMSNPLLPKETPLARKALWWSADRELPSSYKIPVNDFELLHDKWCPTKP